MKKGTKIILIIVGILILIGLAYYFLVYKPSKASERGGSNGSNGSNGNASTPQFKAGETVYLKLDAPSPGSDYSANDTVVYSAPYAVSNGQYVIGKLHRDWYGNQPIGKVIQDLGNGWVKTQVGMVSDFRVYPFTVGQGYSSGSALLIAGGKGSKDVFFFKEYLTNTQF